MRRLFLFSYLLCFFSCGTCFADKVIWSGEVNSDGTPTKNIKMELGQRYQIKVSGTVNLGKWWQQGQPFAEDASYEFHPKTTPIKLITFKNSLNIPLDDEHYHPDHIYKSHPFIAAQSGVHFWVHDTDYSDNNGLFHAQLIQVDQDNSSPQ